MYITKSFCYIGTKIRPVSENAESILSETGLTFVLKEKILWYTSL